MSSHYRKKNIVEEKKLYNHRCSTEETYIYTADRIQNSRQTLVLWNYPDGSNEGTDYYTDDKTGNGYYHSILQTLDYLNIPVVVDEYFYELLYFCRNVSHEISFQT